MDTIETLRNKARSKLKTIVLPEYYDKRAVEAAQIIQKEGLANVILLTKEMMSPQDTDRYIEQYYNLRKAKGITLEEVKKIFTDTLYHAAMMTREGKADGFVAGASHTTPDVARAAIHCLEIDPRISIACSCFIMTVPDCPYGQNGTFVFADCGIIPDPNSRQLACISIASAELAAKVLNIKPKVALLSYSTKGSAKGRSIDSIVEALQLARSMSPDLLIDGELQVDAAIVPEVAQIKYPDSPIGGQANVLIFPDLEAGNIGYKLVQRLGRSRALGPLILGLNKPCSDLS
ncbi:MAG: phosphate acyltransferase, partial [Candidatus Omnitrophica bacterium]|nr:phosphate acyltransferase [Candidatus Omnitrophota bacterium]